MAYLYLDTNLWNISCDQELEPHVLLRRLDQEGSTLVLSLHAVDELSRTFLSPLLRNRAKRLFSHLAEYMNSGLRCFTKENPELLKAEMWAFHGVPNGHKFLACEDVLKIGDLVARYATGELPEGFIEGSTAQTELSEPERLNTVADLTARPVLASELAGIQEADFPRWVEEQMQSATAIRLLMEKLGALFPAAATLELNEWSTALIRNGSRVALGMVRADYYYNWRCARRGSNPKDVLPDLYHVINAAYCDVYATEDIRQSEYTKLFLKFTRSAFYDRKKDRLDQWLVSIAKRETH